MSNCLRGVWSSSGTRIPPRFHRRPRETGTLASRSCPVRAVCRPRRIRRTERQHGVGTSHPNPRVPVPEMWPHKVVRARPGAMSPVTPTSSSRSASGGLCVRRFRRQSECSSVRRSENSARRLRITYRFDACRGQFSRPRRTTSRPLHSAVFEAVAGDEIC